MAERIFASCLIIIVGFIFSPDFSLSLWFLIAPLLNCFLFANLGVIVGMVTKSHEDTTTHSTFFVIPKAFFSGTFSPVDKLPVYFKTVIYVLPLTHASILIRRTTHGGEEMLSLCMMIVYAAVFFLYSSKMVKDYSE
jgi:ABC-type multidrug transport system permease subunit